MKRPPTRRRKAPAAATATGPPGLDRLRAICRGLSGVTETGAWGHPNFKAGGRTFATYEVVRGRPSIAVRVGGDLPEMLIDDQRFFRTPYGGAGGWVSAWVDQRPDWRLLGRLVRQAHAGATEGSRPPRPRRRKAPRAS